MKTIGLIVKSAKNDVKEPVKVEQEPKKAEKAAKKQQKSSKKTKELELDGE